MKDDPNQINQANTNPSGNDGGNRRERLMPESPSSLFQRLDMIDTHAYTNFARNTHEQPRTCFLQGRRNTNTYIDAQGNTQGHEHIYDQYHPYMNYIPLPPDSSGMGIPQRDKEPPSNDLQQ